VFDKIVMWLREQVLGADGEMERSQGAEADPEDRPKPGAVGMPARDRYQEEVFGVFFREALESGGALLALDAKDGRVIGSSAFGSRSSRRSRFSHNQHWPSSAYVDTTSATRRA
jgi:hypothetical protein